MLVNFKYVFVHVLPTGRSGPGYRGCLTGRAKWLALWSDSAFFAERLQREAESSGSADPQTILKQIN